jgi:SAM-dependent methyltransferase
MNREIKLLHDAATRPFRRAGLHAWYSVRGKLRFDPVFFALLTRSLLPDTGGLLDLGCGRGVLLALLAAARAQYLAGRWPRHWPPPPLHLTMHGIDLRKDRILAARHAIGSQARLDHGDVRRIEFAPCAAIVILDMLLYLNESDQVQVLERAVAALGANGVLVMREADADAGFAFGVTKYAERLAAAVSGRGGQTLHYRRSTEWVRLLESLGLSVSAEPMSAGTPFANVMLIARHRMGFIVLGALSFLDVVTGHGYSLAAFA